MEKITKYNLIEQSPHYTKKENYVIAIHSYFNPLEERVLTIVDPNYIRLTTFKQMLIEGTFNADFSYGFRHFKINYNRINVCSNSKSFVDKVAQTYPDVLISIPYTNPYSTNSMVCFKAFPTSYLMLNMRKPFIQQQCAGLPNLTSSFICAHLTTQVFAEVLESWEQFCYSNKF